MSFSWETAASSSAGSSTASTDGVQRGKEEDGQADEASGSHLDLGRAPYVLYGVKFIDLVSLTLDSGERAGRRRRRDNRRHGCAG